MTNRFGRLRPLFLTVGDLNMPLGVVHGNLAQTLTAQPVDHFFWGGLIAPYGARAAAKLGVLPEA